jgi:hypothetical protein
MTFPRARLTVAAVLFVGWIGYLLVLVILSRHTVVLSRPQMLTASVWALAEVTDDGSGKPAGEAHIIDLLKFSNPAQKNLVGEDARIPNLPETVAHGYVGPGKYILPLENIVLIKQGAKQNQADIKPVPTNPGYVPTRVNVRLHGVKPGAEVHVAGLAQQYLGVDANEAREAIDKLMRREATSVTLARNVPREKAMEFFTHLRMDQQGKQHEDLAAIALPGNDVRIYPWTPETKEQLDALKEPLP